MERKENKGGDQMFLSTSKCGPQGYKYEEEGRLVLSLIC